MAGIATSATPADTLDQTVPTTTETSAANAPARDRDPDRLGPLALGLSLAALALASRYWLTPALERLRPGDHSVTFSSTTVTYRDQPDAPARTQHVLARRSDRVLMLAGPAAIVQGGYGWTNVGESRAIREHGGLYGVDRTTRANLAGYGDRERDGHYAFPPGTQRANYRIWDPGFGVAWHAQFQQVDRVQGIETYRFALRADAYDDSENFRNIAGVPERWRVATEARGTLWIEPRSGVTIDRAEYGTSWFVAVDGGARLTEAASWRGQFTPEIRQQQLLRALRARRLLTLFDTWLPGVLLALTLLAGATAWRRGPKVA